MSSITSWTDAVAPREEFWDAPSIYLEGRSFTAWLMLKRAWCVVSVGRGETEKTGKDRRL